MATAHALSSAETIELFDRYVVPNYRRYPISLTRGEGSWVWDNEGRRYLDFFPGWGCNLLGHCPPRVVKAVQEQVAALVHVPNTWYMEAQGKLAEADQIFQHALVIKPDYSQAKINRARIRQRLGDHATGQEMTFQGTGFTRFTSTRVKLLWKLPMILVLEFFASMNTCCDSLQCLACV